MQQQFLAMMLAAVYFALAVFELFMGYE